MAIAALVFGILGLTFFFGIASILALVFGYIAKGQIDRSAGREGGRGMAVAGIVMGWAGVVISMLFVLLLVLGAIAIFNTGVGEEIKEGFEAGLAEGLLEVAPSEAGCGPIERFENQGQQHIRPGAPHPPYNSDPPTSGPHHATPAETGFYQEPLAPETLVHNLEHGQIVIWYNPDAEGIVPRQVQALVEQEPIATVGAPYSGLDPDVGLVLTAWQRARACAVGSQQVVDDFRRRFQGRAPEPLTPPFTG
ncbi:MAG: DUF3105 domain-containing protein [Actinomycetota bacterium]|nr:DUF3105 domain-containing protein [Actinomycetota bacterium]